MLRGVKILLVEDHKDTREMFAGALRSFGAEVFVASSAQGGLLSVEAHRPDLMVVDLELPDVDGWTFLEAVRRLPQGGGRDTPAVAVTAHNDSDARRRSLLGGFRLHVPKPIDGDRLAHLLAGVLSHWDG